MTPVSRLISQIKVTLLETNRLPSGSTRVVITGMWAFAVCSRVGFKQVLNLLL